MSTFSPNIQYEEVARGGDVGTWDTPTNSNWSITDSALGNVTTISLNNTNVVLSAAQFQSKTIVFNSTLTGNVTITFPTSFLKSYEIYNTCTGSSAFTITLETTGGGQVICAPPGQITECLNNGPHIFFKNLPPVGSFIDMAANPLWNQGCSVPPYLDCNGSTFNAATYPALNALLGGNTLPDCRGRAAFYLNEGTGRLTSGGAGIDGTTLFAAGGNNGVSLGSSQIPTLNSQGSNSISVAPPSNGTYAYVAGGFSVASQQGGPLTGNNANFAAATGTWVGSGSMTGANTISVNTQGTGGGVVPATVPGVVTGIRMIRAG
jgi:Phage Tail Collar Domain